MNSKAFFRQSESAIEVEEDGCAPWPKRDIVHTPSNPLLTLDQYSCCDLFILGFDTACPYRLINMLSYQLPQFFNFVQNGKG